MKVELDYISVGICNRIYRTAFYFDRNSPFTVDIPRIMLCRTPTFHITGRSFLVKVGIF